MLVRNVTKPGVTRFDHEISRDERSRDLLHGARLVHWTSLTIIRAADNFPILSHSTPRCVLGGPNSRQWQQ
jgi:hypothetical protein